jgi:hypothetical protein
MKAKLAQFIAGLLIYFFFGMLIVFIVYGKLSGNWGFILLWTLGMAIAHAFIMEPFRQRLIRKQKSKR